METIGGVILVVATGLALVTANSAFADQYAKLRDTIIGPSALHLDLTVGEWATDGLLAVFFFVVGLELKRELIVGELRNVRQAVLPIIAAIGGMVIPAAVAITVAWGTPGAGKAWPIPVATDIAFALAVLALTASALPTGLRIFLLSLAVIDDLGSIILIAVLFTAALNWPALIGAAVLVACYALLQRLRVQTALMYVPLALAVWATVHMAGIHATVAGIALGLATRVKRDKGEVSAPGERMEHLLQPLSAGVCVPLFAFFAAGVVVSGDALHALVNDRVAWAVIAGLVVGKFVGVSISTWVAVKMRIGRLPHDLHFADISALGMLAGCGFTVSLLINELAFGHGDRADTITLAVLLASLSAALIAVVLLRFRVRQHTNTPPIS